MCRTYPITTLVTTPNESSICCVVRQFKLRLKSYLSKPIHRLESLKQKATMVLGHSLATINTQFVYRHNLQRQSQKAKNSTLNTVGFEGLYRRLRVTKPIVHYFTPKKV